MNGPTDAELLAQELDTDFEESDTIAEDFELLESLGLLDLAFTEEPTYENTDGDA